MKGIYVFLIFWIISSASIRAQGLDSLKFVFQTILDKPAFKKAIKKEGSFLCNGRLLYAKDWHNYETNGLLFDGDSILLWQPKRDSACAWLDFHISKVGRNRYEVTAFVSKILFVIGCQHSIHVSYSAILKIKRNNWVFKKEEVNSFRRVAKFL